MACADYLRAMLSPLGVYDISDGSISGGELSALGQALDECSAAIELCEREGIVTTAVDEGIERWESLFSKTPASLTVADRRAAVCALLNICDGDFTLSAINRDILGCGVNAKVEETDDYARVRVRFPDTVGVPEGFERVRDIILDIIPCHLETEFYFRYLTWTELERIYANFGAIDAANLTWDKFEQTL